MTLNAIYTQGKNILMRAGCEAPAFDAMRIFEFCFKLSRQDIILRRNDVANDVDTVKFLELIHQRAGGRPLQYILGYWSFMDVNLKVGEGVLIPRDDTEVLVNTALECIKDIKSPKVLDLCTGPGTIAISLAKQCREANIVAVDISEVALSYLRENIALNDVKNVVPIQFDVLNGSSLFPYIDFDIIVSNPPYIPTSELKGLQREVQKEPKIALDGGDDGLIFYREIAKSWTRLLKNDGTLCVEVGKGQALDVAAMFLQEGLKDIVVKKDLNNIERVVLGRKDKSAKQKAK